MYRLARALLFLLAPERAHRLGMLALRLLGRSRALCQFLRDRALEDTAVDLRVELAGLRFEHPLALAAGLDKDAEAVEGLFALGFAAVEIGTVTPRPQPGNPAPRLFRLPEQRALINRMGFNNHGAAVAAENLKARAWRPAPLGVNLGKNKDTPLERAVEDYVACVDALAPLGDYVVINASSPNTPGLRQLQEPEQLTLLLRAVKARLGVARLGPRGDGANLHRREAEREEAVHRLGVLVQAGGEGHRVGEAQARHLDAQVDGGLLQRPLPHPLTERPLPPELAQAGHAQAVGLLRGQQEQQGTGRAVERGHRGDILQRFSPG